MTNARHLEAAFQLINIQHPPNLCFLGTWEFGHGKKDQKAVGGSRVLDDSPTGPFPRALKEPVERVSSHGAPQVFPRDHPKSEVVITCPGRVVFTYKG